MAAYALAFPGSKTIVDPMSGKPYAAGVFIPAFGPPKSYDIATNPLSGGKLRWQSEHRSLLAGLAPAAIGS